MSSKDHQTVRFTAKDLAAIEYLNEWMYFHYKSGRRAEQGNNSSRRASEQMNHQKRIKAANARLRDLRLTHRSYQEVVLDLEEERKHATGDFPELRDALLAMAKLVERTRRAVNEQAEYLEALKGDTASRQALSQRRKELRRVQKRLKWRKLSPTPRVIRGYRHEFNHY